MKVNMIVILISTLGFFAKAVLADELTTAQEIVEKFTRVAEAKTQKSVLNNEPLRGIKVVQKSMPKNEPSIDLTIHFKTNSAKIRPESRAQVKEIATALKQLDLSDHKLMLIGHTDSRGSRSYNWDLSYRRAQAVKMTLVDDFAISLDNLISDGKGETEIITDPVTDMEDLTKSRRVQLRWVEDH